MKETKPTSVTMRSYHWFVAAAVLFAIGLGALALLGDGKTATGEDDTRLLSELAYLSWLLSWLGAIISVGMGVFRIWRAPTKMV